MEKLIKISEQELTRLIVSASSENPVSGRFGPGWVALDREASGAEEHIEKLAQMRDVPKETI